MEHRTTESLLLEINYQQGQQKQHHPDSTAWKFRSEKLTELYAEMSRRSKVAA